ncbi:MAG: TlpA family protein disulfide reductase [Phycisphaerae bacterium]|nr:TlpA family protein disulfide reductase [Phycisphaerae bacterium]MDW8262496.1 TlpA disulfide reductase family protein [Phycisphaerales bacterium]
MLSAFLPGLGDRLGRAQVPNSDVNPSGTTTYPSSTRDFETILAEYQRLNAEVIGLVGSPDDLLDPVRRQSIGSQAVPLLHQLIALADEMSRLTGPAAQFGPRLRASVDPVLAIFNDAGAIARLEALAGSEDRQQAVRARAALLSAQWVRCDGDPTTQSRLLDAAEKLAHEHPEDDNLATLLWRFVEARPASPEIRDRARTIATTLLTGELASQINAQLQADERLARLVGTPLALVARRHDGELFDLSDWRGRIVVIDFFVSEWPPSQRNLEQLTRVFEKFHGRGVEFVGVSCDDDPAELQRFLKENPRVCWPILYDPQKPGIHAFAQEIGVHDPHALIVVDRSGIVRSTDARQSLETLLHSLLNE